MGLVRVKIGKYEGSSLTVISMLPVYVYKCLGNGMSKIGPSYWINFILLTLLAYVLISVLKKGIIFARDSNNIFINYIFDGIYLVYIFSYGLYSLCLGTNVLYQITASYFSFEEVVYITLLVSFVCSSCGIEALSRTAYVVFGILAVMLLIMSLVSYKGWTFINFTPVLGNSVMGTFFDFSSAISLGGILTGLYVANYYKNGKLGYSIIKKSLVKFFVFSFIVTVLCIFCAPYPMITLYPFSLSAVLSVAKSGVFFHRFETILVIFVSLINVISTSFYISTASSCICKISGFNDAKPYSLVISGLFYFCIMLSGLKKYLFFLYTISTILLIVMLFLFVITACLKGRKNEISEV